MLQKYTLVIPFENRKFPKLSSFEIKAFWRIYKSHTPNYIFSWCSSYRSLTLRSVVCSRAPKGQEQTVLVIGWWPGSLCTLSLNLDVQSEEWECPIATRILCEEFNSSHISSHWSPLSHPLNVLLLQVSQEKRVAHFIRILYCNEKSGKSMY